MRVLVTGARGQIGTDFASADAPPPGMDLRLTDLRPVEVAGASVGALDIGDRDACHAACEGVDAVLHLAADPSPDADFRTSVLPVNILGTYNLIEAAVDAGVPRIVFASSAQAVAGYPLDHQVRESDPPRPANDYGVGKAFGEALGASVAARTTVAFVAVRIGNYASRRPSVDASRRDRMAWLSPADAVQLLRATVTVPVEGFVVAHGISDNAAKQLSIEATRENGSATHPTTTRSRRRARGSLWQPSAISAGALPARQCRRPDRARACKPEAQAPRRHTHRPGTGEAGVVAVEVRRHERVHGRELSPDQASAGLGSATVAGRRWVAMARRIRTEPTTVGRSHSRVEVTGPSPAKRGTTWNAVAVQTPTNEPPIPEMCHILQFAPSRRRHGRRAADQPTSPSTRVGGVAISNTVSPGSPAPITIPLDSTTTRTET